MMTRLARLDVLSDINRKYATVMNYPTIDRFLVAILWWHLGFAGLMAFANSVLRLSESFPSPFSWRVLSTREAAIAMLVGIAAAAIPSRLRGTFRNHYAWRILVSTAFTVYSYLFVFLSGGSIEMHFHFFMVMALLTVYSDWRLGWVVLILTAAHHGILNYVAPGWVYFYGRNDLAVVAHALPVAATAIFTSLLCNNTRRSVVMLEQRIEDRKRAEALLAGEKRILEMVAKGDSLPQILDSLCRLVEEQAGDVLASILLLDGNRLRHGAAPSLPGAYTKAIDGAEIGPSTGSCGTSAYRGEQVIVEDIATDPLWAEYRALALPHSLRACWSTPVFSSQGKVIATFAMYYHEPRRPSLPDQEVIEQITHLAGIAIQRKLTEEKLQASETYLAEAQRLTHTGSWAYDPTTWKPTYWSEEMYRIWGFAAELNIAPDLAARSARTHQEDRNQVRGNIEKAFREGIDYEEDYRIVLPDGTVKHLHAIGHPAFDEAGEIVEYIGTTVDVTERKQAEEEREKVRRLEADLAHINRISMMGELAASLAHEVNQPIAAAVTNARTCLRWLTRDEPDLEEAREAARRIVNNGTRAAEIIARIRSFYTKKRPQWEAVDINEVAGEMLLLLRNEADRHSIAMRADLAADLPTVTADRVQLQQVFMNLMLNGIEAMKELPGELVITSARGEDGHIVVSVQDSGVGLPPEKADQIYEAFFTTKPQGTGMGLTITRSIVERHGGRLWAAANSGRGATFHFTLPVTTEAS